MTRATRITGPSPASSSLRAFFAWLERNGAATTPRSAMLAALGGGPSAEEALAALEEAGVAREGPTASTLPCGEAALGCARRVVGAPDAEGKPMLVATCGARPRVCETIDVDRDALRQVTVSMDDLARVLREELDVTDGLRLRASTAGDFVVVGEQPHDDGTARDVVLFVRPSEAHLDRWLAAHARGPRGALVLLPTAHALSADAAAKHGPGALVEVDLLTELLTIRDGLLRCAARLRVVRAAPVAEGMPAKDAPAKELIAKPRPAARVRAEARTSDAARRLPAVEQWERVRVTLVDGETVSVRIGGSSQRLTYIDMGLAGRSNRKPTQAWKLLTMCCEGHGSFEWKDFGSFENARQVVARLRKAMRAVFGLEEDPFQEFTEKNQWVTRFRAGVEE